MKSSPRTRIQTQEPTAPRGDIGRHYGRGAQPGALGARGRVDAWPGVGEDGRPAQRCRPAGLTDVHTHAFQVLGGPRCATDQPAVQKTGSVN